VSIPVLAVGGIRSAAEIDDIVDAGDADLVGIGRPFYAEPDLAARILGGGAGPARCRNSNLCVPAQMLGMKGVCYNPEVRRATHGARET
jgi:2,4-dienoyl-CoA reductase-like NADH-dependent reductase (Old Yellow Enzyme family)